MGYRLLSRWENQGCCSSFCSGRVGFIKRLSDAHFWLPSKQSRGITVMSSYFAVIALLNSNIFTSLQ